MILLFTFVTRHDGGVEALDIPTDVPADQLKDMMIACYNTEVVAATRNHSYDDDESVVWLTERRRRTTSSNVCSIAKRRSTTPVGRMVHQLLYSIFRGNSATRWGLQQESHSASVYVAWLRDKGSPNSTVNINMYRSSMASSNT